jgi:hypothetical protein
VSSYELHGGPDYLYASLERGLVFLITGNVFPVNNSATNLFPTNKVLPFSIFTCVEATDFGKQVITTTY